MRAFHISDPSSKPGLVSLPLPRPGPEQVTIRLKACGLNFADLLMAQGRYQDTPEVPFTLGMEAAGVITAVGKDVADLREGQRVAVFSGQGGLAEEGVFDAAAVTPIPDKMPFDHAAAFQIAYGTSHMALDHCARLQPGERLLVTGAAGGVGLTAIEIGKLMGAEVIAQARGAAKLDIAESAGADHLIDGSDDLRLKLKALGGADVVYDAVGGDTWKAAFRATNPGGRLLPIGFASGEVPQIPANHLLVKNLTVIGFYWGGYRKHRPDAVRRSIQTLLGWYSEGRLTPHISHRLPLDKAADGLELLRSRASTGKVVITM